MLSVAAFSMLADLSLYFSFLGVILCALGADASLLFAALLLLTLSFSLAALLHNRGKLRYLSLLLIPGCFLLPGTGFLNALAVLPAAVYVVLSILRGNVLDDAEKRRDLFLAYLKLYPGFSLLTLAASGGKYLAAAGLPMALIFIVCSVVLLRSLRHEKEVYQQPSYQLINLLGVAAAIAAAVFLSSEAVVSAFLAALGGFYRVAILPVLVVVTAVVVAVVFAVGKVLIFLISLIPREQPRQPQAELDLRGAIDFLDPTDAAAENPIFQQILIGIAILAVSAAVIALIRYLLRRRADAPVSAGSVSSETLSAIPKRAKPASPGGTVAQIRALYRRFLRLCAKLGLTFSACDTSLDVERFASPLLDPPARLRQLYLRARYDGSADREDVREMKSLCDGLREKTARHGG